MTVLTTQEVTRSSEKTGALELFSAECPRCHRWCFAYSKEAAGEGYMLHNCLCDMSQEELDGILDRAIEDGNEAQRRLEGRYWDVKKGKKTHVR